MRETLFLTLVQAHQPENLRRGNRPSGSSFLGENCVVALTRHPLLCYSVFWSFILVVFASYFAFLCSLQRGIAKKTRTKRRMRAFFKEKSARTPFSIPPFSRVKRGILFFFPIVNAILFLKATGLCKMCGVLLLFVSAFYVGFKDWISSETHTHKGGSKAVPYYIYRNGLFDPLSLYAVSFFFSFFFLHDAWPMQDSDPACLSLFLFFLFKYIPSTFFLLSFTSGFYFCVAFFFLCVYECVCLNMKKDCY